MTASFDVLILGGGAAGLMCAIEAGRRGRRVAVLERAEKIGKKILISGGGRCNFTNIHCGPEHFLTANPYFPKSALAGYTPSDFIALVERHRIPFHEKTLGQFFCDRSARDITDMLEAECRLANVRIYRNSRVRELTRATGFRVRTQDNEFHAAALVVATGGLSLPKIGATSLGYDIARQCGLKVRDPRPALVPLALGPEDQRCYCDLSGVSAEVIASADHHSFREKMLITHRGLSGPAILQVSSYWKQGRTISLDLVPGRDFAAAFNARKSRNAGSARAALQQFLPNRLASRWLELHSPVSADGHTWSRAQVAEFDRALHHWAITPADTLGYEKAEVTAGGVDTDELSAKTMESRRVPGLFFIGEVVDVTGHLGGFNFQWAWASGAAAGRTV
jgi:predicted Rossmann fold flavoprotein